ncbi:MAG: BT_3928 family protein [Rikenellaceae bacterium]
MEQVHISESSQRSRRLKIASHIARLTIGIIFVFSGFVKVVDPWGTMIKVNEYLAIYGIEWFSSLSVPFSIWISGAEMMMGLMFTFKVRIRLVSIFALISMSFFTLLSFLSATIFPVEDCGCFGDAIRLTPWATFAKNAVLLPMAGVVWYRYKPDKIFAFNKLEAFLALFFFTSTMSLGTYCYFHLPLLDFRPYKIGVNLPEAISVAYRSTEAPKTKTTLIFRNLSNGRLKEFSLDDTKWQDETKWEWVDTITEVEEVHDYKFLIAEFSVFDFNGKEQTSRLLSYDGEVALLTMADSKYLKDRVLGRVARAINRVEANGGRVIVLTPEAIAGPTIDIEGHEVECYNIDPTTMKTMIRANVGIVVLEDGVIVDKRSWRDM